MLAYRQRDLQRRNVAVVQIRAQFAGGVRRRLVLLPRVAAQPVVQKPPQRPQGRRASAAEGGRRRDRNGRSRTTPPVRRCSPASRACAARRNLPGTRVQQLHRRHRAQVLRQHAMNPGTDRVRRVAALRDPAHRHDATRIHRDQAARPPWEWRAGNRRSRSRPRPRSLRAWPHRRASCVAAVGRCTPRPARAAPLRTPRRPPARRYGSGRRPSDTRRKAARNTPAAASCGWPRPPRIAVRGWIPPAGSSGTSTERSGRPAAPADR